MSGLSFWLPAAAVGVVFLALGAHWFIDGAADGARRMRVSPMLVGLFLAGFATSLPEAVVAAVAAWKGSVELALGNAVGSNIANIGLVLGAAVLFMGLKPERATIKMELSAMVAATLLACALLLNGYLSRFDALLLLAALAVATWLLIKKNPSNGAPAQTPAAGRSMFRNALLAALGLACLLVGAELLVRGAQQVARIAGVDELVIGATAVAIGTSLPELAITIAGVIRREAEIALGNVIGSNIFNLLVVIGIAGAIAPSGFSARLLTLHAPILVAFTLWFVALSMICQRRGGLGRGWSISLLLPFAGYMAVVVALAG